jgi:DNA polymerase-3 subunit beta
MPILSMVLMKAEGEKLSLSATDLDISVTSKLDGRIEKEGAVAVPARKVGEIIKSLSGEEVQFETENDKLNITCGRSRFEINGRNPEDFPEIPKQEKKFSFKIEYDLLHSLIEKTIYAVSTDLSRPALCGVLWKISDEGITMVSTDGHRLAKIDLKKSISGAESMDVIIPPKALSTLSHFSGKQELVNVNLAGNSVSFSVEDMMIYSRLLEGPFPDFNRVIPEGNKKKLSVSVGALSDATGRVSILSDSLTNLVVFSLDKNKLVLKVETREVGGAREELDAEYSQDPMEIGYNARYVQDILKTVEGDSIDFMLDRPDNAGVAVPGEKSEEYEHMCIIMPLRIN